MLKAISRAARSGALLSLPDYVLYRTPARSVWARLRGHRFHRSSLIWILEGRTHTRATLLLPRLKLDYPEIRSAHLELVLRDAGGREIARKECSPDLAGPWVFDSKDLERDWGVKPPFEGSLLILMRLDLPDETALKKHGAFNAAHTYIDYYEPGNSVATLHDYCAFLPHEGFSESDLGMIPAYCDGSHETFVVTHAASAPTSASDLTATLTDENGRSKTAPLSALKPFEVRRRMLSEMFPDAAAFLNGRPGHLTIRGVFRHVMTRLAYGVLDKKTGAFSVDHCYYAESPNRLTIDAKKREQVEKGWCNPFFVLEDASTTTTAVFYHGRGGSERLDLLIYDAAGKLAAKREKIQVPASGLPVRFEMRGELARAGVAAPFTGHAEIFYSNDGRSEYRRSLDLGVEYRRGGRPATVIFGAEIWNAARETPNKSYRSACRVICDDVQTTRLAISNVSYAYNYDIATPFTLTLVGKGGAAVASKTMSIGPNASLWFGVEDVFPDAKKLLEPCGGVGYTTTTDIRVLCLTHLFFTEDRKSGALSVEHSLDV